METKRYLLCLGLASIAPPLLVGLTPPNQLPLREVVVGEKRTTSLDSWLKRHTVAESPFDNVTSEQSSITEASQLGKALIALGRARRVEGADLSPTREQTARLKHWLDSSGGANEDSKASASGSAADPLLPYYLAEWLEIEKLEPILRLKARMRLRDLAPHSCAERDALQTDLANLDRVTQNATELVELAEEIITFEDRRFRERAFITLLQNAEPKVLEQTKKDLWQLSAGLNRVRSSATIFEGFQKTVEPPSHSELDEARSQAGRRRCDTADAHLSRALKAKSPTGEDAETTLTKASAAARAVGQCYSSRGRKARETYWQSVGERFERRFGFAGWAAIQSRQAYLHWAADRFDEAKKILKNMLAKSLKAKDNSVRAQTLYTLGRVTENEGEHQSAAVWFEKFVGEFTGHEDYDAALEALVLLYVDQERWPSVLEKVVKLLARQDELPEDERSTGGATFALFWSGRAALATGDLAGAKAYWQRLANEYYSSYYGALGHHLLETFLNRKLALAPTRSPNFSIEELKSAFPPAAAQQIKRVEALLKVGLHESARCELLQLASTSKAESKDDVSSPDSSTGKTQAAKQQALALQLENHRLFFKSLVLHASGNWLESIRAYSALPRTYRHSLPAGAERLLYPVRFNETIADFGQQARVDPDLVRAIIRQESVYNPAARSPVGARGLMQLMPATARLEATRLSKDYATAKLRRSVKKAAQQNKNLHLPEVNLILGIHHVKTLLSMYKNPVFVLAAYNASPNAASRWRDGMPHDDLLTFIERIPYRETRGYVKLVMRNYFYYKKWYGPPAANPDLLDEILGPLIREVAKAGKRFRTAAAARQDGQGTEHEDNAGRRAKSDLGKSGRANLTKEPSTTSSDLSEGQPTLDNAASKVEPGS